MNNTAIIMKDSKTLILLFKIPIGERKYFFETDKQFRQTPSKIFQPWFNYILRNTLCVSTWR